MQTLGSIFSYVAFRVSLIALLMIRRCELLDGRLQVRPAAAVGERTERAEEWEMPREALRGAPFIWGVLSEYAQHAAHLNHTWVVILLSHKLHSRGLRPSPFSRQHAGITVTRRVITQLGG